MGEENAYITRAHALFSRHVYPRKRAKAKTRPSRVREIPRARTRSILRQSFFSLLFRFPADNGLTHHLHARRASWGRLATNPFHASLSPRARVASESVSESPRLSPRSYAGFSASKLMVAFFSLTRVSRISFFLPRAPRVKGLS